MVVLFHTCGGNTPTNDYTVFSTPADETTNCEAFISYTANETGPNAEHQFGFEVYAANFPGITGYVSCGVPKSVDTNTSALTFALASTNKWGGEVFDAQSLQFEAKAEGAVIACSYAATTP
ncbi:hypothetical protein SEUCBS139899_001100 [Sporothrix eucalyptigena]|uniref:AA1-like domain-containing protein n=1 Tax=Sporothrix eucalyptigena TaxID=1812306 RepID=A0ABP0B5N4_9PEZI